MVCINKCFAPWKINKKKQKKQERKKQVTRCRCTPGSASPVWNYRTPLPPLSDREPLNAARCVQAHTGRPRYHC